MSESTQDTMPAKQEQADQEAVKLRRAREVQDQTGVLVQMLERGEVKHAQVHVKDLVIGMDRLAACVTES